MKHTIQYVRLPNVRKIQIMAVESSDETLKHGSEGTITADNGTVIPLVYDAIMRWWHVKEEKIGETKR